LQSGDHELQSQVRKGWLIGRCLVTHGGSYPAGGGVRHEEDNDFRGAARHASDGAGDSGDTNFFGNILSSLGKNKKDDDDDDIDEDCK
jgi:hypothetical protein